MNGVRTGLGVSANRHGELVLSWADSRFAEAVAEAHEDVTPAAT
ncbi:hypothetical protein GCM10023340_02280 [Nocardioides marinquilinus]|uniref:Uncharacterized protein n=1 Tax=Nocardioides marinquilinus TaxID=1210400 RepID=A0ABP9P5C9_9ACTN